MLHCVCLGQGGIEFVMANPLFDRLDPQACCLGSFWTQVPFEGKRLEGGGGGGGGGAAEASLHLPAPPLNTPQKNRADRCPRVGD